MKRGMAICFEATLALFVIFPACHAATITFDLRNLGSPQGNHYDLMENGLGLSFSDATPGNAAIVSTLAGIGIDSGYVGEVSGFINGRLGTGPGAEALFFSFSQDVLIQSVTLVWNSVGVVPVISPKSAVFQDTVLGNGTTALPDLVVGRTSANTFLHSTTGTFPANGGFAIQSITVSTIPEPGTVLSAIMGLAIFGARRRAPHRS